MALAQRYVRENFANALTLEEVARVVYLNGVYLSRLWKERTGVNFVEYLARVRVEQAAKLLRETNLLVSEVCERVGYHNLNYFYKQFRRIMGCSAGEYRDAVGGARGGRRKERQERS